MRRVSLDALTTFVTVARSGSISAGASELRSTQSTVSDHIAGLEKLLQYKLFDRTPRGVSLTNRGRQLLQRIEPQIDAAVAALDHVLPGASMTRDVLLGGPAEFLSEMVLPSPGLVPGDATLRIQFGQSTHLLASLAEGGLDAVVSSIQPRMPGIEFRPIFDETFALVMTAELAEAFVRDRAAVPVLTYSEELPIIRRYWRTVFLERPGNLRISAVVPDLRVLGELAARGEGMTVLPHYLAERHLRSGALVDPVEPAIPPMNTLYLARRRARPGKVPDTDWLVEAVVEAVRRSSAGSD